MVTLRGTHSFRLIFSCDLDAALWGSSLSPSEAWSVLVQARPAADARPQIRQIQRPITLRGDAWCIPSVWEYFLSAVGREEALRCSLCETGSRVAPHLLQSVKSKIMYLMVRTSSSLVPAAARALCSKNPVCENGSGGANLPNKSLHQWRTESFGRSALSSKLCRIPSSVGSWLHLTAAVVMSPCCFIWVKEKHFPFSLYSPCPSCVCVYTAALFSTNLCSVFLRREVGTAVKQELSCSWVCNSQSLWGVFTCWGCCAWLQPLWWSLLCVAFTDLGERRKITSLCDWRLEFFDLDYLTDNAFRGWGGVLFIVMCQWGASHSLETDGGGQEELSV